MSYLQIATKVTAQETLQTVASTYTDTQSLVHSSLMIFQRGRMSRYACPSADQTTPQGVPVAHTSPLLVT